MHYVYILESLNGSAHFYVGSTSNLRVRLAEHQDGRSPHTSKYRPWKLKWYAGFESRTKAEAFETYLKTASGRAFQMKHIAS